MGTRLIQADVQRRAALTRLGLFAVCALLLGAGLSAPAQQAPTPDAPKPALAIPAPAALPLAPTQALGTVTGVVMDSDNALVPGAKITLRIAATSEERTAITSQDGIFTFTGLPAGDFTLTAASDGLASAKANGLLHPGEDIELPEIILAMASASTNVDVVLSRHDQVEMEVKAEEKQRIVGAIPNFFVTYNWNAKPLSAGQKYELAWRMTLDPVTFVFNGAVAGLEQAEGDFKGYGQGGTGYAKRYAASFADNASGNFLGGAVLPSLLHQDPRYFFKGTGSIPSRALYALSTAVICRGDNGRWQPNYSSVLGDLAAGGLSNLYYPKTDRHGWTLTIENGVLNSLLDGVGNVVQEFLINRLTPGAPHGGTQRP